MNPYVLLAKNAVETYIKEGKTISPPADLPEDFHQKKAGVFVTINKQQLGDLPPGEQGSEPKILLRGCIGTYLPTRPNIAQEIIRNAIAAATEDFRFGEIQKEELPYLSYFVYLLSYPEQVKDLEELDPKKFGIIVKTTPFTYPNEKVDFDGYVPFKTGLLLPTLENIETAEKQFLVACQKAGINPKEEKTFIYKFTVEKFE